MTDTLTAPSAAQKPEVRGGLVTYLQVDGAMKASALYQRAFGASQVDAQPTDEHGRTMHVHLYVNGSSLMMSDAYPEHGCPLQAPQGFTLTLALEADEIDHWWERAVAAGLEVKLPLQLMFWGDRYGQLTDAFGINWAMVAPPKAG